MKYKHLDPTRLIELLETHSVEGIEQWIRSYEKDGFRFIQWVRIVSEEEDSGLLWCLYEKNSLDIGSEKFINLDAFREVGDPDEPEGRRTTFSNVEGALEAARTLGAKDNKYVAFNEIPFVYREFVLANGTAAKGSKEWLSG